jgi:hypothetical protein
MSTSTTERRRSRVSPREAAQILQCSRDNVRRLIRDHLGEVETEILEAVKALEDCLAAE